MRIVHAGLIACVIVSAALLVSGCFGSPIGTGGGPSGGGSEPTEPHKIEVREYEGRDLSSVEDFRENSIKGPQQVDVDTYRLRVTGLVEKPLELGYEQVLADNSAYTKVVTLNCVEGWSVDILWEGVRIADLLESAGADTSARIVIFRSVDGYSTSLPLEFVRDRGILLAYKMNGVVLPPERGFPFQVVAEDKWGYKWAKWVEEIEVSDDASFEGYWERRGYSNDGDLSESSRD